MARKASEGFRDRVAIVTGGASGIGLAAARRLAAEGANVVLAGLDTDKPAEIAGRLQASAEAAVWGVSCDVASERQVQQTIEDVMARFSRLDIVVNSAGVMIFKPLEQQTEEDWSKVLGVNLLGTVFFTKHAFFHMLHGGSIVNISSIHAEQTTPLVSSYAASKGAVLSFTRAAAIEGKEKGIRVNAVLPGAIDTPMLRANPNIQSGAETIDPSDVGSPDDVASAVVYLASDAASFVTGTAIRVDGGRLSRL
jgi:meso-butanediol dehydrogenase / (S,S)-butanediol dehydrogenase / diacetyl reductase